MCHPRTAAAAPSCRANVRKHGRATSTLATDSPAGDTRYAHRVGGIATSDCRCQNEEESRSHAGSTDTVGTALDCRALARFPCATQHARHRCLSRLSEAGNATFEKMRGIQERFPIPVPAIIVRARQHLQPFRRPGRSSGPLDSTRRATHGAISLPEWPTTAAALRPIHRSSAKPIRSKWLCRCPRRKVRSLTRLLLVARHANTPNSLRSSRSDPVRIIFL